MDFRDRARDLLHKRLPSYPFSHCVKILGGSPHEFSSRCVCDSDNELIGIVAFSIGQLFTVEIVAFVSVTDGQGIGRYLMENFVLEMREKHLSAILTYVEPAAVPFFSRLSFSRQVPARSLYERVVSKYVKANLMYLDLLVAETDSRAVNVGDRLMVLVDGTMTPRQCLVKEIAKGQVLVHYYFWNSKHDEWIYPHSPRICWDIELPADPPKRHEQVITGAQVKQVWANELMKEQKLELVHAAMVWPRGIKKNALVQVKVEGGWEKAKVIEKTDFFCYCEFNHVGQVWLQDFPRESVRLIDSDKSVMETLMGKKSIKNKPIQKKIEKKRKIKPKLVIQVSPTNSSDTPKRLFRQGMPECEEGECSVCTKSGLVLKCRHCHVSVHPECYFIDSAPPGSWLCDTCKESFLRGSKKFNPACVICQKTRYQTQSVMAQSLDYKSVHVACALENGLSWTPKERRFSTFRSP